MTISKFVHLSITIKQKVPGTVGLAEVGSGGCSLTEVLVIHSWWRLMMNCWLTADRRSYFFSVYSVYTYLHSTCVCMKICISISQWYHWVKMSPNNILPANTGIWLFAWRCPWCNGYRRRNWTWRHEFKSWTRLIAFHIALIPLGKVWIQLFSLQLWVNSRAD